MTQSTLGVLTLYIGKNQIDEMHVYRKLSVLGERMGLSVMVFTPEDVASGKKLIHAHIYDAERRRWLRRWMPFPKLIYDRCRFQRTYRFQQLKQFRAKYGHLKFLNRPMNHKWGNHQILSSNASIARHLPETVRYQQKEDLFRFLHKYPIVYLKPEDGTGGRGIVSIRRTGGSKYLLRGRNRQRKIIAPLLLSAEQIPVKLSDWNLKKSYLIQQGIDITLPDGRVHDFRLLIQKNGQGRWEVTGCAGRIGPRKSVTSNLHGGGSAASMEALLRRRFDADQISRIRQEMESLSHEVVIHLEKQFNQLCEMALDLAVDREGKVWLLEVNPKPSREVFHRIGERETYLKAIKRPLEYALWLSRDKGQELESSMWPEEDAELKVEHSMGREREKEPRAELSAWTEQANEPLQS
ncbi:YheC/YheD family protein [Paenibacillus sp. J2TS4]|uniref:YheC/YheD family endospore coat-associated protein n=1 Tax=Paenibacillus sp. J2TS4 TaxID=2807194 RepID=UPI001B2BFCE8|nr:YheC/YheD family protein [Paenibacillus sp. J2TS4]GIP33686.1 endospore coat-associated protein YheC [Paenibacillus sp. J2TS4]